MLTCPSWITFDPDKRVQLRYLWDDTRAMLDFTGDAAPVLGSAMKMSLRARMVLCMGLFEWVIWRFDGLHSRVEPLQIATAGWCATVDPRYLKFFELTREEWLGSIEGPLWCAAMWLQPAMSRGYLFPRELYDGLSFLTRLCIHVLPEQDRFQRWLTMVLDRLVSLSPAQPEDPFLDLFNRDIGRRLGPLIGRNVLDIDTSFDPHLGVTFLAQTLRDAVESKNPYLSSPDDLKENGFLETPYQIPTWALR